MIEFNTSDIAWAECSGRFVFLDIAQDRYFQLPAPREKAFRAEFGGKAWYQPPTFPRPPEWVSPHIASPEIHEGPFLLAGVAAAIWAQRRVERRISARSFSEVLLELKRLKEPLVFNDRRVTERAAELRAFEHARLLRSAADRCLSRSIALALRLARRGIQSHIVIGVRSDPFGAHCWAQQGDAVLNDTAEEVLRYTPILVV
ncbi:MAG: lasso peptide biosynthesis B2 protein [Alteraurantiacibacter sp. bin_em_oilr2.035]|nr:lasso peptide biosynthesis B2 protein [Alteraurantiacibacter sp. bin_em_oilr2.035]